MPYTAPSYLILVFNLSPPDTTAQYRPRALRGSDPTMVRTGYDAPDIKWKLRRHVKVHWSSCLYHVQTSCSPDYVACHHLFGFFTLFLNPWFYKQMPPSCLPLFISWPRLPDPLTLSHDRCHSSALPTLTAICFCALLKHCSVLTTTSAIFEPPLLTRLTCLYWEGRSPCLLVSAQEAEVLWFKAHAVL